MQCRRSHLNLPLPFFQLPSAHLHWCDMQKKNWTCPIYISAWQTNQKDAEYHLRVVLMVWRNSDAHKQKKTPATASFKAFWEFCEAGPLWLFFFFTACLSFLAIRFSLELETSFLHWSHSPSYTWKSWELSGPSSGRGRGLRQVHKGNGFCSFPLFFLWDCSLLENALWII